MNRFLSIALAALFALAPTCQTSSRTVCLGTSGLWPSGSTCGADGCPKADAAAWADFWTQAKAHSDALIGVHTAKEGLLPTLAQVKAQGLTAVVVTDLGVPDTEIAAYQTILAQAVTQYDVWVLCLGNEIDLQDPAIDAKAAQAKTLLAAVKAAKPGVLTCTVLQYEKTRVLPDAAKQVAKFGFTDIVAVTSYPNVGFSQAIPGYATAAAIPSNYYAPLLQWAGTRKVAFTEVGWDTGATDGVNQQAEFLKRMLSGGLVPTNSLVFADWFSLYDFSGVPSPATFTRMGLLPKQGATRPADAVWKSALSSTYKP